MVRAQTLHKRTAAVRLLLDGLSYEEIAATLGYANRSGAWKAVTAALRSEQSASVEEYRDMEVARLDALQAAHWNAAVSGDAKAAALIVRIIDQRIRLLGLDRRGSGTESHTHRTMLIEHS